MFIVEEMDASAIWALGHLFDRILCISCFDMVEPTVSWLLDLLLLEGSVFSTTLSLNCILSYLCIVWLVTQYSSVPGEGIGSNFHVVLVLGKSPWLPLVCCFLRNIIRHRFEES